MVISKLKGISRTTIGKKPEFSIHFEDEYDYRFQSDKRSSIIMLLQVKYHEITKKNLPIFDIPEQNLKGFTTTEKDKKRGVDRFPLSQFRNRTEDIVKEEATLDPQEDEKTTGLEFDEGKALRDQQYAATKDYGENVEEDNADEEENEVKASIAGAQPSQLVFKRSD
mmetsp:Transcript_18128/g.30969  ORF Transcript_18128/g.30969 Transcript_18128/m.30969 type:complete len:167 (-) Transcript_18128:1041-1541(-)